LSELLFVLHVHANLHELIPMVERRGTGNGLETQWQTGCSKQCLAQRVQFQRVALFSFHLCLANPDCDRLALGCVKYYVYDVKIVLSENFYSILSVRFERFMSRCLHSFFLLSELLLSI
jgi:hypothetical protein